MDIRSNLAAKAMQLLGLLSMPLCAGAQTLQADWWVPNGEVNAVVKDDVNNTVILGGNFSWVCPPKPFGLVTNATTGVPEPGTQYPDGEVYEAIADGNGGWYICGEFNHIGGQPRRHLARISANGSLHPWNPDPNGVVETIERVGNIVYAAGSFSQIGGAPRSFIAALDGTTGLVAGWSTASVFNGNGPIIRDLAVDGNTLYIGGEFGGAGNCFCVENAMAVDRFTGEEVQWYPAPNQGVMSIEPDNGEVFIAGYFDTIAGVPRNGLARVTTGWNAQAQPFDAGLLAGQLIHDVVVSGNTAYLAGTFTSVGGQSRTGFAAVHRTTGAVQAWDAQSSGYGSMVEVSGTNLLVGGNFAFIGGASRYSAAALDLATASATAWAPNPNGNTNAVATSAGKVFLGGAFTGRTTEGVARNRLAALDAATGVPTGFNPNVNSSVYSLALSGNTLYVGGGSTLNINGQARAGAGAVNVTTGATLPWSPNAPGFVHHLQANGNTVYLGGGFLSVGGTARNRLAAVDATTGVLLPWNPNANNGVRTMALSGTTLYVGGDFSAMGGTARNRAAAFDLPSGNLLPWDPNVAGFYVNNIVMGSSAAYLQGPFQSVGGQTRFGLASVDLASGAVSPWAPGGNATALDLLGNTAYVAGTFTSMAGVPRNGLANVDATTGLAGSWDPGASSEILHERRLKVIDVDNDAIRVAGDFGGVQGIGHPHFVSFGFSLAPQVRVAVHAFLEGPFDGGTTTMNDALRTLGVLPTVEPHSAAGFVHVQGGNELCAPTTFAVVGNNAIVDWVVVELRDAVDPTIRIETRSALIQRDGDVVAEDGVSPVGFSSPPGNYHVALRHRNHLGVMTAAPLALGAVALPIDFATSGTGTYGTAARKNVNGTMVLWAGNTVHDGFLKYGGAGNDRDPILVAVGGSTPTNTVNGYYGQDVNMDGVVKYTGVSNDRDPILINVGGTVPTAVRAEQLP